MNSENKKNTSRKKFILGGISIMAVFAGLKFFSGKKKSNKIKMLTEDGKLVEVDAGNITKTGMRVSNQEIHSWIKNKPTL